MKKRCATLATILACGLLGLSARPFPEGTPLEGANFPAGEADHAIHLSKCQLRCADENLELKCHIWLDDLTEALAINGIADPQFLTPDEADGADEILKNYLREKIKLNVNEAEVKLEWAGKEASEDGLAIWINLRAKSMAAPKHLRIQDNLLMELYDDQQNIVHLKGPGGKQGYLIFEKEGQVEDITF